MQFKYTHTSIMVLDLERSLKFYEETFGLTPKREILAEDGSYKLIFLGEETTNFRLELAWFRDRKEPYNLGDNNLHCHVGFLVDDYDAAHKKHSEMGCITHDEPERGIYFIADPDGYWMEVVRPREGNRF